MNSIYVWRCKLCGAPFAESRSGRVQPCGLESVMKDLGTHTHRCAGAAHGVAELIGVVPEDKAQEYIENLIPSTTATILEAIENMTEGKE